MLARSTLLSVVLSVGALLGASPAHAQPSPAPLPGGGSLTPSPQQLQFGAVDIHFGGSPQQSVTLANDSTISAMVMSATIGGPGASHFEIVNDGCLGETLEPGSNCAVEIRFRPDLRGEESATLTVELLGGEGAIEVPLTGSGSTGTLSAGPGSLGFSAIPYTPGEHEEKENQSETEQVNIEDHEAGVQIESVSIVGPDASSFTIQYGDCVNEQLASGNWCDAGIRFQPLSPGPKHAQLVITSDSSSGPLIVPLEGEGLLGPKISLASNEALLGDVTIGTAVSHAFTIANSGDYPLFIQQSFLVSGTPRMFPMISNTCSAKIVMPNSSCEFTVGFEPTTTGEKDASLIFITNATPQINVLGVDGIGVRPAPTPTTPSPEMVPVSPVAPTLPPPSTPRHKKLVAAHLLLFEQASRLYSTVGGEVLDTGIHAQCPPGVSFCRTESFIVAHLPSRLSAADSRSVGYATTLLGSQTTRLNGGEDSPVRIRLSNGARALLERHPRLHATIDLVIHSEGEIIAERSRAITLSAS